MQYAISYTIQVQDNDESSIQYLGQRLGTKQKVKTYQI